MKDENNDKETEKLDLEEIQELNSDETGNSASEADISNDEDLSQLESFIEMNSKDLKFDELNNLDDISNIDYILNEEIDLEKFLEDNDEDLSLDYDLNLSDEQLQLVDESLKRELQQSNNASLSDEPDSSYSFNNIISSEQPEKSIKTKITEFISSYQIPLIIAISVLIIAVVITLFFINSHLKYLTSTEFGRIYISQPSNVPNNLNQIFVNRAVNFNDDELMLVKMVLGTKLTVFYFNKEIDIYDKIVTLKDESGKFYSMKYSFNIDNMNNFKSTSVLRFDPINNRTKEFILSIYDRQTGKTAGYHFRLDDYLKERPIKYSLDTVSVDSNSSDIKLEFENMIFSNSISKINYKLSSISGLNKFIFKIHDINESAYLRQRGSVVRLIDKLQTQFHFEGENVAIGALEFDPLYNLDSNLEVVLNNIYLLIDYNKEIPVNDLIYSGNNNVLYIISSDNYRIFLDSIVRDNDEFVLTIYGEDINLPVDAQRDTRRISAELDVKLISYTENGEKVVFNGINRQNSNDTSITFSRSDTSADLDSLTGFRLQINSLLVKLDDITYQISADNLNAVRKSEFEKLEQFIFEAFNSRFDYVTDKTDKTQIIGFDGSIIDNTQIYADYAQVRTSLGFSYLPNIITYFSNANGYTVIVEENIIYNDKDASEKMYSDVITHRVDVVSLDDGFLISSDKIIN